MKHATRWALLACVPVILAPVVAWAVTPSAAIGFPEHDPSGLLGLVYAVLPSSSPIGPPILWFYGVLSLGLLEAVAVATALLIRAADKAGATILASFLLVSSVYFSLMLIGVPHGVPSILADIDHLRWLWVTGLGSALGIGLVSLVGFAARFPRPLSPEDIARAFPRASRGRRRVDLRYEWYIVPIVTATAAWVPVRWPDLGSAWAMVSFTGLSLAALFAAHQLFRINAASPEAEVRARVRWVSSGVSGALWLYIVFGILAFGLTWLDGDFGITAYMVGLFVFGPLAMAITLVSSLAIAVFVGGALDPSLTVRRTTVYGTLILCFAFGFAILEELVSELLVDRVGISDRFAAILLGAVVAIAVAPLKGFADRMVARWLPLGEPGGTTQS